MEVKQPLSRKRRGTAVLQFDRFEVRLIRAKFSATQKEFARLIGISAETLRSWETGRRRPHGPNWYHDEIGEEPEWMDE